MCHLQVSGKNYFIQRSFMKIIIVLQIFLNQYFFRIWLIISFVGYLELTLNLLFWSPQIGYFNKNILFLDITYMQEVKWKQSSKYSLMYKFYRTELIWILEKPFILYFQRRKWYFTLYLRTGPMLYSLQCKFH